MAWPTLLGLRGQAAEALGELEWEQVAYKTDMRLNIGTGGEQQFEGENPAPGTAIHFFANERVTGDATVAVMEVGGRTPCESAVTVTSGQPHRVQWTLAAPGLATGDGGGGRVGRRPTKATPKRTKRTKRTKQRSEAAPTAGAGVGRVAARPAQHQEVTS